MKRSTKDVAIPGVGGPPVLTGSSYHREVTSLPKNPALWMQGFFAVLFSAPAEAWRGRHVMRPYVFDPGREAAHQAGVDELIRAKHRETGCSWLRHDGVWTTHEDGSKTYTGGYDYCARTWPAHCGARRQHPDQFIPAPPPPPRLWVDAVTDTLACPFHHDTFEIVDAEEVAR